MEECPVLIVLDSVVNLLVPYYSSVSGRYIYQLDEEGVSHKIVGEHSGSLKAGVGPSVPVGIGNVKSGDCDGLDLVRGFGYGSFNCFLIGFGEYGRHIGSSGVQDGEPDSLDGKGDGGEGGVVVVSSVNAQIIGNM